jgi:hypothetical protein
MENIDEEFEKFIERINSFKELKDGWKTGMTLGKGFNDDEIGGLINRLICTYPKGYLEIPNVFPEEDGKIMMEWTFQNDNVYVSLHINLDDMSGILECETFEAQSYDIPEFRDPILKEKYSEEIKTLDEDIWYKIIRHSDTPLIYPFQP